MIARHADVCERMGGGKKAAVMTLLHRATGLYSSVSHCCDQETSADIASGSCVLTLLSVRDERGVRVCRFALPVGRKEAALLRPLCIACGLRT